MERLRTHFAKALRTQFKRVYLSRRSRGPHQSIFSLLSSRLCCYLLDIYKRSPNLTTEIHTQRLAEVSARVEHCYFCGALGKEQVSPHTSLQEVLQQFTRLREYQFTRRNKTLFPCTHSCTLTLKYKPFFCLAVSEMLIMSTLVDN